ncbi:MAG: TfoX/Sxy family protein [Candidatus Delongbacteria bacterium]|nr:TfoX/Sxy family protein [Candidatus Cloacimonadota bacterium]MCB9474249.1 TfoX/Sxy family protein [Candidatus Delongbacteria bacterium]
MAFDAVLAKRLEKLLGSHPGMRETRMFGGFGYLYQGNMCVGVWRDCLILRVGLDSAARLLEEPGVRPMDITGKPMKGWVLVEPAGLEDAGDFQRQVSLALDFVRTLPAK